VVAGEHLAGLFAGSRSLGSPLPPSHATTQGLEYAANHNAHPAPANIGNDLQKRIFLGRHARLLRARRQLLGYREAYLGIACVLPDRG
jgi:hypothetical protein